MSLNSATVGSVGEPFVKEVDARWAMSYAAGLDDYLPCYMDTRRPGGVVAHPLFPVCFEWPVMLATRDSALEREEALRGVHATHDLVIHRLVRSDDTLTTQATVVGVEQRKPGAYQIVRFDTTDADGALVCSTWYGTLFRGVTVEGGDKPATELPTQMGSVSGEGTARAEIPVSISAGAAHVYTECARIWNPVHTDPAVAATSGLPGLILHGTATLAHGVSRIVAQEAGGQPERIKRIAGRFGAMVLMPSQVTVRVLSRAAGADGEVVRFEVRTEDGKPAVRDGLVVLRL